MAERVCAIVAFSKILILGGIVKGGCSSFMFIPPFDLKNIKNMNTQTFHLFGFETPRYYCTIKAKSMHDAIEQFCLCFGESALSSVHHIHNCYEESVYNGPKSE